MEFEFADALPVLRRTPTVLRSLLQDLPDSWTGATEGPDTWSPFDVVGHLIDGEETDWVPRAQMILRQGPELRFEPYDRFRHQSRNLGKTLPSLLITFARVRSANLDLLRTWHLSASELDLEGIHPTLGPVTLRELLAAWVVHDLGHLAQISRVMAKQYREAVGPWIRFLPVLADRTQSGS